MLFTVLCHLNKGCLFLHRKVVTVIEHMIIIIVITTFFINKPEFINRIQDSYTLTSFRPYHTLYVGQ